MQLHAAAAAGRRVWMVAMRSARGRGHADGDGESGWDGKRRPANDGSVSQQRLQSCGRGRRVRCACSWARPRGWLRSPGLAFPWLSMYLRKSLRGRAAGAQGCCFSVPFAAFPHPARGRDAKSKATGRGGAAAAIPGRGWMADGSVWVGSALLKRDKGSVLVIKRSTC